tara:strand:- start:1289 stop:1885 length:597 start_codon:yes stop_codon:yes gene_type:complete
MLELELERPDCGLVFVVSGPSGVGKSTLIRGLMETVPHIGFSVSATTRTARVGEVDGKDYYFKTTEDFQRLVDEGAFLEHATVYNRQYGTLRDPTESALLAGDSILLDIDIQGARQIRQNIPGTVQIMVIPPDASTLEKRLKSRGKDTHEVIQGRMEQFRSQLEACADYDYLIVNNDLATAQAAFNAIFIGEYQKEAK